MKRKDILNERSKGKGCFVSITSRVSQSQQSSLQPCTDAFPLSFFFPSNLSFESMHFVLLKEASICVWQTSVIFCFSFRKGYTVQLQASCIRNLHANNDDRCVVKSLSKGNFPPPRKSLKTVSAFESEIFWPISIAALITPPPPNTHTLHDSDHDHSISSIQTSHSIAQNHVHYLPQVSTENNKNLLLYASPQNTEEPGETVNV